MEGNYPPPVVLGQPNACLPGWTYHAGRCYRFMGTIQMSWPEAQVYCRHNLPSPGAFLPEPQGEADINFLKNMTQEQVAEGMWLGGYREGPGEQWKWSIAGEAITYIEEIPGIGDCLSMIALDKFDFAALSCEHFLKFVCQYKPDPGMLIIGK